VRVRTSPVTASFGLIGAILGVILSATAVYFGIHKVTNSSLAIATWTTLSGVCLFFICGAMGIWSQHIYYNVDWPAIWLAELAFQVISAILFIVLIRFVVALLRTNRFEAK